MDYRYDTVIVGAGPAGAACAVELKKNGADVCVIDKAVFPRRKTCAGLVTDKAYRLLTELFEGQNIDGLFCDRVDQIKLYRGTQLLTDASLARPVHLVNRDAFDNALVEAYKAMGGVMMEGETILSVDTEHHRIALSDDRGILYRHLVFADGALGVSHKLTKIEKSEMACGIEAYVPAERMSLSSVNIYFDYLKDGYVWAFPHRDTVCIGLADRYTGKTDYRGLMDRVLRELGVDAHDVRYIGAFLPYGYVVDQEKLPDNVMLAGDAGGFADPISGEGIYMALRTGMLAAKALEEKEPKKAYLDSVRSLQKIVKEGTKTQKLFYRPAIQKVFYRKVSGNDKVVSFFFENMVEDYRYDYAKMHRLYRDYKKA